MVLIRLLAAIVCGQLLNMKHSIVLLTLSCVSLSRPTSSSDQNNRIKCQMSEVLVIITATIRLLSNIELSRSASTNLSTFMNFGHIQLYPQKSHLMR